MNDEITNWSEILITVNVGISSQKMSSHIDYDNSKINTCVRHLDFLILF